MKRLLIGFLSLLLVTEAFAGFGGYRGGGCFRSSSSSFKGSSYSRGSSSSYRTTPKYQSTSSGGSILPMIILMSMSNNNLNATSAEKANVAKDNGILSLKFLKKAKTQEQCNKLSEDEKYIVSFKKDKGVCYGFNRSE